MHPLDVKIDTPAGLAGLSGILHDSVFRIEDMAWDRDKGVFQLHLWRECEEIASRPLLGFIPFIHNRRFRRARCIMLVHHVKKATTVEHDSIGYHSLVDIRHSLQGGLDTIKFETEGAIEMSLVVEEIHLECRDTGEFTDDQFGYGYVTLGRSHKTR